MLGLYLRFFPDVDNMHYVSNKAKAKKKDSH